MCSLQTLHCTIHVFKSHKAHRTISSSIRHLPYHLSQRPDASSPIREPTTSRLVSSSLAVCCSEFHLKYPKECISTNPVSVVPGICDKHTEHDHRFTITEDSLNSEEGYTLVVSRCSPGEDLSTFHWYPGGYKAGGTYRAFTLSCFTGSEDKDTSPILFLSGDGTGHQGGSGGPIVVGNSASHLLLFPNSKTGSHDSDWVRCLKFRLGCSLSRSKMGGMWTPVEGQHHINSLKLKAVFLALQSFLKTKNRI